MSIFLPLLIASLFLGQCFALSEDQAIHLLRRTHFVFFPEDVKKLLALNKLEAARLILGQQSSNPVTPTRAWLPFLENFEKEVKSTSLNLQEAQKQLNELIASMQTYQTPGIKRVERKLKQAKEASLRKLFRRLNKRVLAQDLKAWWWEEILSTPSQLNEKMTIFWHNHFPSDHEKVPNLRLLYDQNQLFRKNALGHFDQLLHAIAKHPSMLIYLDGAKSKKAHPNENFAREVMELFTLGEGHYTEKDIKEAARAFTGWTLNRQSSEFVFKKAWHDHGDKVIFGEKGKFDGDDVLKLLLKREETAVLITSKLWREFISPTPDPMEVKRLATLFRQSHYDIKHLLQEMLSSDSFYEQKNRGTLIKSPVHFIASLMRTFQLKSSKTTPLVFSAKEMGQDLFHPPNVKGWPGHTQWINTYTLTLRKSFVDRVLQGEDVKAISGSEKYGPEHWLNQFAQQDQKARDQAMNYLLAFKFEVSSALTPARYLEALAQSSQFQIY